MSHPISSGHSSNPVLDRLEQLVAEVGDLQSKLVLLVGKGGKTRLLRQLAQQLSVAPLNVGATLGHRLAATSVAERGFSINELLREATDSARDNAPLLLDNLDPAQSRYAQEVLKRLAVKGHGQVLNRNELITGSTDVEYFYPDKQRLEPDLLVVVLGVLAYSGDIVLSITGDKIDSSKLALLAERSLDELKAFKHIEAPKEINLAVLRALFELLGLPPGLAQEAAQGKEEPVRRLQDAVSALVPRVLKAGSDLQQGKLGFWGQNLLRDEEAKDWYARLDALKKFTESLSPYNTVGKLKKLLESDAGIKGPKGGLRITYDNAKRHFDNTAFTTVVSKAWVGTTPSQSQLLQDVIRATLATGKAVAIAIKSKKSAAFQADDDDMAEEAFDD